MRRYNRQRQAVAPPVLTPLAVVRPEGVGSVGQPRCQEVRLVGIRRGVRQPCPVLLAV